MRSKNPMVEPMKPFETVRTRRRGQRGVGLVEALVALIVLALGMVSFAALQSRLRLNSDVAKQRAEAVRIAQEEIEKLRTFNTIAVFDAIAGSTTTTTASSRVSNATYQITRTASNSPIAAGLTSALVRNLIVRVDWADRTAPTVAGVVQNNQSVTLRTIVARSDPAVAASLALAPNGSPVRSLLGRDIQVPIAAQSLGGGESVFKPLAGGTTAYVFNDASGLVTRRCTGVTGATSTLTNASLTTCTSISAYLISGFVRTSTPASNGNGNGPPPDATNPNSDAPGGVNLDGGITMRVDLDRTTPPANSQGTLEQLTAAYWPAVTSGTGSTIGSGAPAYATPECSAQALQNIRYTTPVNFTQTNNGNTTSVSTTTVIAAVPQSLAAITSAAVAPWLGVAANDATTVIVNPTATGERYVAYACLVYPVDLDGNTATAAAYTARVAIWPSTPPTTGPTTTDWTIGTGSTEFKICRYSADYNRNGGVRMRNSTGTSPVVPDSGPNILWIDNQEHTYAYLNSQRSLSNQNFLVIKGNATCPTDAPVEVDGQGGENYTDESTVTHQP
jgi:Tfp pilus assembly protein PilV